MRRRTHLAAWGVYFIDGRCARVRDAVVWLSDKLSGTKWKIIISDNHDRKIVPHRLIAETAASQDRPSRFRLTLTMNPAEEVGMLAGRIYIASVRATTKRTSAAYLAHFHLTLQSASQV